MGCCGHMLGNFSSLSQFVYFRVLVFCSRWSILSLLSTRWFIGWDDFHYFGFVLSVTLFWEAPCFFLGDSCRFGSLPGWGMFNAIFDISWIEPTTLNSTLALTKRFRGCCFPSIFVEFLKIFVTSCPCGDRREDTFLEVFPRLRGAGRSCFLSFRSERTMSRWHSFIW